MPSANGYGEAVSAKKMSHLTLGGDPEVFLKSTKTGKVITSCGKIGGTKSKGVSFGPSQLGLTILEDNVAVEFNFKPHRDYITFADAVRRMFAAAILFVRGKTEAELYPTAVHEFHASDLLDESANTFGCEPDYYAYATNRNEKRIIEPHAMGTHRFCGGHLHLGFANPEAIPDYAVAQLCDMAVGLPSIKHDSQGHRRQFYGKAGLYRSKPYGLEYRTMSNWWMRPEHFEAMQYMAYEMFQLMYYMNHCVEELGYVYDRMPLQDVRVAIENESVKDCRAIHALFRNLCGEKGMQLGCNFLS